MSEIQIENGRLVSVYFNMEYTGELLKVIINGNQFILKYYEFTKILKEL